MAEERTRHVFTKEELRRLKIYGALRMPLDQIAALMGFSKDYFGDLLKKDDAARNALDTGRARSSKLFRKTLVERAIGLPEREVETIIETTDKRGRKIKKKGKTKLPPVPGDNRLLEFFLKTQEGFSTTNVLELTGKDGKGLLELTDEQANELLDKIVTRMKGTTDGL